MMSAMYDSNFWSGALFIILVYNNWDTHLRILIYFWCTLKFLSSYYDVFLKKYQELVKKQNWKQPLLGNYYFSLAQMKI